MEDKMTMDLQLLADVLRENGCTFLIKMIAERDYQISQILDVLIIESDSNE